MKTSEAHQDAFLTQFRTDFTTQFVLPAARLVKRKQMAYQTTQRSNMVTSKTFISLGKETQRLLFRISPSPCYPLLSYIIFLAWAVTLQLSAATVAVYLKRHFIVKSHSHYLKVTILILKSKTRNVPPEQALTIPQILNLSSSAEITSSLRRTVSKWRQGDGKYSHPHRVTINSISSAVLLRISLS